jgi:hypothetical protein
MKIENVLPKHVLEPIHYDQQSQPSQQSIQ